MTFTSPSVTQDQINKLAQLIDQAGSILVVDAALISPAERDQIHRVSLAETKLGSELNQWNPELRGMLAKLSAEAQAEGSPETPPELPRPAYAQIFEACFKQLGLIPSQKLAPWAYWQALADGISAKPDAHWMAVEPCQWLVSTQQVQLQRCPPDQPLSSHLYETMKAGLDRLRASLVLGTSGRAYLQFENAFDLQSAWPECLEGLGTDGFLPAGAQARDWRGFVTELEMALALRPDPNNTESLWPWGMGAPLLDLPLHGAPKDSRAHTFASGALDASSTTRATSIAKAPLPLQGLQQWLESQGRPLNVQWHSFRTVQRVEDWMDEWALVLVTIQALAKSCMAAQNQPAKPWAVLLQDRWSYKLFVKPEGQSRHGNSAFLGVTGFVKRVRDLGQGVFTSKGRKAKKSDALAQLLQLASWGDGDTD